MPTFLSLLFFACSTPSDPSSYSVAELDLDAVVEQAHFAFHDVDGVGLSGGHTTYEARVDGARVDLRTRNPATFDEAALSLETRGEPPTVRIAGDGHLELERSGVVEHLRNTADGLSQSWTVEKDPVGPFVVEVDVDGLAYVGTTPTGVHFADPTGLGFVYGHGTWVDAAGAETPVPVRWAGDHLRLEIPAKTVAASAFPAVLDPIIGPEVSVDEPMPVLGHISRRPTGPDVCSNGSSWLVVWQDPRNFTPELRGTFVGADGTTDNPDGFSLGTRLAPSCAWDGGQYLVASAYGANVRVDTVAPDATTATHVELPTLGGQSATQAHVQSSGTQSAVIWKEGNRDPSSLRLALFDASGNVDTTRSVATGDFLSQPSVAAVEDGWFVVYFEREGQGASGIERVRGVIIDPTDSTSEPAPFDIAQDATSPSIAAGGDQALVTWEANGVVRASIYAADGSVSGQANLQLSASGRSAFHPRASWTGSKWFVHWFQSVGGEPALGGAFIDPTGQLEPFDAVLPSLEGIARSAWTNERALTVWNGVRGIRLGLDGTIMDDPSDPLLITPLPNRQEDVHVVATPTGWMLVWKDTRLDGLGNVFSMPVDAAGSPSGVAAVVDASVSVGPALASHGSAVMAAWSAAQADELRWAPLGTDGTPGAVTSLAPSSQFETLTDPRIATGPEGSILVYDGGGLGPRVLRLEPSGEIRSGPLSLDFAADPDTIVWTDNGALGLARCSGATWCPHTIGMDGSMTAEEPVNIGVPTPFQVDIVDHDGQLWAITHSGAQQRPTHRTAIDASGQPLGEPVLTSEGIERVRIARAEDLWTVAWSKGSTSQAVVADLVEGDNAVGGGTVLSAYAREAPNIAVAGGHGTALIAYTEHDNGAPRLRVRVVDQREDIGAVCESGLDCLSGACTDGVCCDQACDSDCMACAAARTGGTDGTCAPTLAGSECGSNTADACTAADTCDGQGTCLDNHVADDTVCADADITCVEPDTCQAGVCTDGGFSAASTPCGDSTDDTCTAADTCDGAGSCLDNHAPDDTVCSDDDVQCVEPDTCSGGQCVDNGFSEAGTPCGNGTTNACTSADSCDGSGTCLDNHAADGTACSGGLFCTAGDTCASGVCVDGPDPTCDPEDVCVEDLAACVLACGDGVLRDDEECDDGEDNSDTEPDACRTDCTSPTCGDGVTDTGEGCDNGDGNSNAPDAPCRPDCALPTCGDGIVDSGEECDDGAANALLSDACRPTCMLPACGDGIVDSDEECDGAEDCTDDCTFEGDVDTSIDTDTPSTSEEPGCSCQATSSGAHFMWLAGILAVVGRRRGRRQHPARA